jgi:hypothetical protein
MGHTTCTSQEATSKGSSMNTTFKKDVDCPFSLQGLHYYVEIETLGRSNYDETIHHHD